MRIISPLTNLIVCLLSHQMVRSSFSCRRTSRNRRMAAIASLAAVDRAKSCCRHEPNLFRLSGIQVEPFIAKSHSSPPSTFITSITNVNRFRHRILSIPDGYRLFRTDIISSGRISSLPDGYHLFRTDSVHTERMQDIRGVSGTSI